MKLEIRTDSAGQELEVCQAITTMDYTQVRANGLLLTRGTKLTGRIFELRSSYDLGTAVELGLQWKSIAVNGANYPIDLSLKAAVRNSVMGVAVRRCGLQTPWTR